MIDPRPLSDVDPAMAALVAQDTTRQNTHLHLIASENFVSRAVLEATGSVFTNKYAEGYPGKRYYEGCETIDEMETLAQERAVHLFGGAHANVQPSAGAQANAAVYVGILEPNDTFMGMSLDDGGHLTHGHGVSFTGKYYNAVQYGVDPTTEILDMDVVRDQAVATQPRLIVAGYSAYPRHLDYAAFRSIADEVGAIFMVDAAHFIGLVAGGVYPNPLDLGADVMTATTHKALRGARGGLIMSATEELGLKIQRGLFPGTQGGSLYNQIAGKAVAFHEAAQPAFAAYAQQVLDNAQAMAQAFTEAGVRLTTGGTDNHLMVIDLRSIDEELTGRDAARFLQEIGITLNFNTIPNDPRPPFRASGLRIGTPAVTTQGLNADECSEVALLLVRALTSMDRSVEGRIRELADAHPPYPPEPS